MWQQVLVIVLGLWLVASPDVMGYEGPERINNHVTGSLIVFAALLTVSSSSVLRWANVLLGSWLVVAPTLLGYEPLHIGVRSSLIGAAVILLSLIDDGGRLTARRT